MAGDNYAIQRIPQVNFPRSLFNLSYNRKDTFSPDLLYPVAFIPSLPNDTMTFALNSYFRFNNINVPVMAKLDCNVYLFYSRARDLYKYFDRVIGAKDPDDTNIYRLPYISNYSVNVKAIPTRTLPSLSYNSWSSCIGNYASPSASVKKTITYNKDLLESGITLKQNGVDYKLPVSLVNSYIKPLPNNDNNALALEVETNKSAAMLQRFKCGGLGDRLYGVCGDTPKVLNAMRALMYYKICDYYYRPQYFSARMFAEDDKYQYTIYDKIEELGEEEIEYGDLYTDGDVSSYYDKNKQSSNLFACDKAFFDDKSCVCNSYDYEQKTLSAFLTSNVYVGTGEKLYVKPDKLTSYNYAKFLCFLNNGLYPVSKRSDYLTLALPSPQYGEAVDAVDPVPYSAVADGLNIVGDGILSVQQTDGSTPAGVFTNYNSNAVVVGAGFPSGTGMQYNAGLSLESDKVNGVFGGVTVEELRERVQLDKYMRRTMRGGTRYNEFMRSHYGVYVPDTQLGIPQLFKISRGSFDIIPVVQTSSTDQNSPQGTLTANGICKVMMSPVTVSTTEFGYFMVLLAFRTDNIYQEQYDRDAFTFDQFDFYQHEFVALGDDYVRNYEVYNPYYSANVFMGYGDGTAQSGSVSYSYLTFVNDNLNSYLSTFGSQPQYFKSKFFGAYSFDEIFDYQNHVVKDYNGMISLKPYEPYGYQERYAYLRYHQNELAGQFKSRAGLVQSVSPVSMNYSVIDPNVSDKSVRPFVSFYCFDGYTSSVIGSLDIWHYGQNFDSEANVAAVPFSKVVGQSTGTILYHTSFVNGLGNDYINLNSQFIVSNTPWKRSAFYKDLMNIYGDLYFTVKMFRALPATVDPGMMDHF